MDFITAGCVMNEEERGAIVNVVKDREPRYVEDLNEPVIPG